MCVVSVGTIVLLQRDFDQHPLAGAVAVAQRGEYRGGEMDSAEQSTTAGPAFIGGPSASPRWLSTPLIACTTGSKAGGRDKAAQAVALAVA